MNLHKTTTPASAREAFSRWVTPMFEPLLERWRRRRAAASRPALTVSCQRALMVEREPAAVVLAIQVALRHGPAVELRDLVLERIDGERIALQPTGHAWLCKLDAGQSLQAITALVAPPFRIELACRPSMAERGGTLPAWCSQRIEVPA